MIDDSLTISLLEIRSPVPPEFGGDRVGRMSGYVFEYFETPVSIQEDGLTHDYPAHVCIMYAPGDVRICEPSARRSRTWFHVEGPGLEVCLQRYAIPINRVMTGAFGSLSLIPFLEDARRHMIQRGPYWEDAVTLLCLRFFRNLARAIGQTVEQDEPSLYQQETLSALRRLRAQIHSNLRHRWTIDEMAALAHLSPAYYRQLYTAHFQISPIDDLIGARIRQAKLLMSVSSLSIDRIAEVCGFNSASQFHVGFRKRTGHPPGEYMRTIQQSSARSQPHRDDALDDIALLFGEPVGYWNFDDEDGPFDQDYHFRFGPVKLLHGATVGDGPWGGSALRLGGQMAHGEVPAAIVDTAQSFTVCAWVLIAGQRPGHDWMTAVSIGHENHCSFFLQYCASEDRFMFTVTLSETDFNVLHVRGTNPATREAWVHLCGVHDRESGTISLYENGERTETLEFRSGWTAPGPTLFGASVSFGHLSDIWIGRIAEIRFYARALAEDEVRRVYNHRRFTVRPDRSAER